jgi:hypothetical protein
MRNEKQAKAYAKQQGRPRRQTLIDHLTPPKIIFLKTRIRPKPAQARQPFFRRNRSGNQHGNKQASKNLDALGSYRILNPCHMVKPAYGATIKRTAGRLT